MKPLGSHRILESILKDFQTICFNSYRVYLESYPLMNNQDYFTRSLEKKTIFGRVKQIHVLTIAFNLLVFPKCQIASC